MPAYAQLVIGPAGSGKVSLWLFPWRTLSSWY
jgi:hypothetical protein